MVPSKLNLRERNRLTTMRLAQQTAVEMFEADGFDATPVEAIAAETGVSPSTIYRLFGTKEALVTWDEQDRVIDAELGRRLGRVRPVEAFKEAVRVGLAERPDPDLFVRRLRLMYREDAIGAAAVEQDLHDRSGLAAAFAQAEGRKKPTLADDVLAGVCLAALDAALDHWQRDPDAVSLTRLLDQAFAALDN